MDKVEDTVEVEDERGRRCWRRRKLGKKKTCKRGRK